MNGDQEMRDYMAHGIEDAPDYSEENERMLEERRRTVTMYRDYFGPAHPAMNVKVPMAWLDMFTRLQDVTDNPHFTREWIMEHVSDDESEIAFQSACELGWDCIKDAAVEVFGQVEVYSEGRSGGWAVVYGLPDVEDWDADDLRKWNEFRQHVEAERDDVPYRMADWIHENIFRPWVEA